MYTLYYNIYKVVILVKEVVSARLPPERVEELEEIAREEKIDRSTVMDRALEEYIKGWKLKKALSKYTEGEVTLPRAAEIAELSIWEIMDEVTKRGIKAQYSLEDLEEDLKAFENE
jgi:predicted HTH domain antitoxin